MVLRHQGGIFAPGCVCLSGALQDCGGSPKSESEVDLHRCAIDSSLKSYLCVRFVRQIPVLNERDPFCAMYLILVKLVLFGGSNL